VGDVLVVFIDAKGAKWAEIAKQLNRDGNSVSKRARLLLSERDGVSTSGGY